MDFELENSEEDPLAGLSGINIDLTDGASPEKIDIRNVLVHDDLLVDFGK